MTRLVDYLAGALSGMLVALIICAALAPDAWTVAPTPRSTHTIGPDAAPTPRPSPQADPGSGTPGMTTEGVSPLPSPDSGARTVAPDIPVVAPAETPTAEPDEAGGRGVNAGPPSPPATNPRRSISGTATWFRSPAGVSAAGPALRAAVGPGWRGTRVTVCGASCARTVLGDWMRADKLIDLDDNIFVRVCGPLSRGVCNVVVRW